MGEIVDYITGGWIIATSIVTIASVVANWTKTDKDNKAIEKVKKLMQILALNFNIIPKKK